MGEGKEQNNEDLLDSPMTEAPLDDEVLTETGNGTFGSPRERRSYPEHRASLYQPHIPDFSQDDIMSFDSDPSSPEQQKSSSVRPRLSRTNFEYFSATDISYNPSGQFILYSPPKQRQKWGDNQVLPRVNWGDLFFDLFYVGASFNLGNVLVDSPTWDGVLYFLGAWIAMVSLWDDRTFYDARFVVDDDMYHRAFEVALLVITATAATHIRPVQYLENPAEHGDMFAFCTALTLGALMHFIACLEIAFFGKGQKESIRNAGFGNMKQKAIQLSMYIAATIYTSLQYFPADNNGDKSNRGRSLGEEETYSSSTRASDTTATQCIKDYTPICLVLFGAVAERLYHFIYLVFYLPRDKSHQKYHVPINIDFFIHRNGEWTMLVLGESILSLLVVQGSGRNHNVAFYVGVLTVILLQYLHFRSLPHHAEDHALRRSISAGAVYINVSFIYTAALIVVGASFKLFLKEYNVFEHNNEKENLRQLLLMMPGVKEEDNSFNINRLLAAATGKEDSDCGVLFKNLETDIRRQSIANMFCASLAIAWLCLDVMIICHVGIKKQLALCRDSDSAHGDGRKLQLKGIGLILVQLCLIAFVATISRYETDPKIVSLLALIAVITQLLTRFYGEWLFGNGASDHH
eukprot:CAMPEP_0195292256 /NCGR_PEP_ID=MMETSP0707-20130614/8732_1 /TAXON_ID=33640 /ORGANISM="Asterionellopsis glacialis, Strain CCMP134" /LENGTH=631 /DNA_ID=CAMNT_0040352663 /DNA_START=59 /DNA_END=1954 /DNA_ORIENTATION=+